jgi:hypothetical protein
MSFTACLSSVRSACALFSSIYHERAHMEEKCARAVDLWADIGVLRGVATGSGPA